MNEKYVRYGLMPSKIRELFEYGKKRKKEIGGERVFDFSIGNPSSPVPEAVTETLMELLKKRSNDVHAYTVWRGDSIARKAVADHLHDAYGVDADGELVYLTCGAAAGLAIAFHAFAQEGEEAVVFAPFWPEYRVLLAEAGLTLVPVYPDENLLPNLKEFETKIGPKTAIVVYNSPNNPTGVLYKEDVLRGLAEILKKKQKEFGHPIYLISDEPYRELIYDDVSYPSPFAFYENSVITYSYSKSLSLPGARIGYIALNPHMEEPAKCYAAVVGAGRCLGYVSAPTIFQHMLSSIQGVCTDLSYYRKNRDALYQMLCEIGYEAIYPDGAFYLFVKAPGGDANAFSEVAKEYELLLVPSDSFGLPGYVRVSYCVEPSVIARSKEAFTKLFHRYQKQ